MDEKSMRSEFEQMQKDKAENVTIQTPKQVLEEAEEKRNQLVQAEIQKKLTKAVPYFRGQIARRLGLRYAPEIRFYRDNT